ncbi:MAG TPA: chemotaxis protein MotB [Rhodospirillaceae bacterium]|nr:chemotaxis protein MotB [Rhodospirillaceae bacterium]HAA92026.1 chemotaxis protein MotB [Rhodospirillaceae bacterium]HAT34835.1 chemotaxis protein MotB [Rhodospirillaceae bacterium]
MADDGLLDEPPLVVKKKKRIPAEPHGGAWKVAYADFVTAMMAFFLLLWLLNVTTEATKAGISDYYEPEGVSEEQTGSGGVLKGLALAAEGALRSSGSPPSVSVAIPTFGSEKTGSTDADKDAPQSREGGDTKGAEDKRDQKENQQFETAAQSLRQAIQEIPELAELQDSLLIENTPEGLRIMLVDQQKISLFKSGATTLTQKGEHLFAIISAILRELPHNLRITGHTDRSKFGGPNYSNWELSGDRANTVRKTLTKFKVDPKRVRRVAGKADRDLLDKKNPSSPRNRRVDILLVRRSDKS